MRAAQAMKASKASKAKVHAKNLGLTVNTGSASVSSNSSSDVAPQCADTFSQIATAPAKQLQFKITDKKKPSAPKESEALSNPDWRTNRRVTPCAPRGAPVTAGLEKTEFREAGGHPPKKADIDTSPESLYGARRYRTTPIDPDFIHSAPITKKDFKSHGEDLDSKYHVQDQEEEEDLDVGDIVERVVEVPRGSAANHLPMVKLEPLSSTVAEGFKAEVDYRRLNLQRQRQEDGRWVEKWSYDNIPLMASPVEPSYNKCVRNLNFPLASVKAIKESKRFKDKDWDEVPRDALKNLAKFAVPHTAGLPPDRLRQAYEQSKRVIATDDVPEDPEAEGMEHGGRRQDPFLAPEESKKQFEKDQARFEALISKLQQSSAHRLRGQAIDIKPPHWTTQPEESKLATKETSIDSGVGDLGIENKISPNSATTLNPLASEFCFSSQGISNHASQMGCPPEHKENTSLSATQKGVSPSLGSYSTGNKAATAEDIQALLKSMNELKTEIAQLKAAPQQPTSLQALTIQKQLDYMESLKEQIQHGKMHTDQGMHAPTQPAQCGPEYGFGHGTYSGVQPYGGYTPSQQQYPPAVAPAASQPNQFYHYGMYNAGPGYNGASFNGSGYAGPSYGGTTYNGSGPNGMGFNGPSHGGPNYHGSSFNAPAPSMPSYGIASPQPQYQVAPPPPGPQSFTGPPNPGPLPLHTQAQMAFGPKPVRKPKGPPRPGDHNATKKQQEYEQYLEIRRAMDPAFARDCKARQARRAERQRGARGY
ncbi:hypothetical protein F4776DRAFT_670883 [Hypoxylon sp. NC0597]|nr:hypothetical protein F4776DRAFT_670883 [Hypoxylon sp. NC0597]